MVISGDTYDTAAARQNAQGADLLIHDAVNRPMVERMACMIETVNPQQGPNAAQGLKDAAEDHTDTLDLAEAAQAAGVRKLVLTHILPPIPAPFDPLFMAGMDAIYTQGEIVLTRDGDSFYLAPDPSNDLGPCDGPCTLP